MLVNEVYEGDCLDVMREFPDNCKSTIELNKVYLGDCLKVLKSFPDNFVSTILTDPPYDLTGKSGNGGFMGKKWDSSGIAFNPEVWREALRIAKPGATLMAFGGSRTYHRLVCAIEDAGWEIRDCISYFHDGSQQERAFMASLSEEQLGAYLELHHPGVGMDWVYGSGIGLGHNVSKGIDKAAGAEREVVGISPNSRFVNNKMYANGSGLRGHNSYEGDPITAPATPLAAKFDGWNTRLKPAHEPIVLAMKPIESTFAANAEKWGVAGLNIDGGRVETNGESLIRPVGNGSVNAYEWSKNPNPMHGQPTGSPKGRFPANVIHDGSEEVMAEFDKAGVRTTGGPGITQKNDYSNSMNTGSHRTRETIGYSDSGSAARFFQQCPPDPPQSNPCLDCTDCIIETEAPKGRWPANVIHDGSEEVMAEFDKAGVSVSSDRMRFNTPDGVNKEHSYGRSKQNWTTKGHNDEGTPARFFQQCPPDPTAHPEAARFHYCPKAGKRERGQGNNHPTVKPLSLLRYLAKLTRPPDGGVVLDPFGGSGTTALAAIAEGRDYIIIEKEPEYAELCRRRIAEYSGVEIAPVEVKVESDVVKQMSLW